MKLSLLKSFIFFQNMKFIEIEFNTENLNKLNQRSIVEMHDDKFKYTCYRVGCLISIQKSGKLFGNCGSHGIYVYNLIDCTFYETPYKYQDKHVEFLLKQEKVMNNYKIRVNNEAESLEARGLFCELGFSPDSSKYEKYVVWVAVFEDGSGSFYSSDTSLSECQEITLPQLKDLVVLHRNDIDDANWETEGGDQIYEDSSGKSFVFRKQGWDELQRHEMRQAMWEKTKPKPQTPENKQGLISGADALRGIADGEDVEVYMEIPNKFPKTKGWVDASVCSLVPFAFISPDLSFKFRLKPKHHTVKLEIEVPAPFEPKVGDYVYFICSDEIKGYAETTLEDTPMNWGFVQFGAWRTEAEIIIVVEQLRKLGVLK